jgi:selenocysteine-specific elongation factor
VARTVVVGTAGHVDHGKSSLVKALTGTDPDRLKEEQERGITIDLGFAHASERDGVVLSFVDVPGHERFVRNMLAGAAGIDVVLLVVAADESVMPQTREHLDVCRLLDVHAGVIALTKADLVDEETLDLVKLEVSELVAGTFLQDAPLVACSAVTRAGLDDLVAKLHLAAASAPERPSDGPFRLPIDRAFTLKGFGAVVTGTSLSGSVAPGDDVEILPAGRSARVRGVHAHGIAAERGLAGARLALNLGGIDHHDLQRGDVVVTPGSHVATSVLESAITLLPDAPELDDLARVRVYLGTAEVMARIRWASGHQAKPGGAGLAQVRLETPVVAAVGDRFILRRYSPVSTIGGGQVLSPATTGRLKRDDPEGAARLVALATAVRDGRLPEGLELHVGQRPHEGATETQLAAWTGRSRAAVAQLLQ